MNFPGKDLEKNFWKKFWKNLGNSWIIHEYSWIIMNNSWIFQEKILKKNSGKNFDKKLWQKILKKIWEKILKKNSGKNFEKNLGNSWIFIHIHENNSWIFHE